MATTASDDKPDVEGDSNSPVPIRKGNSALRKNRQQKKERTPTTVVSEVFAFLNQNPSSGIEDLDEFDFGDKVSACGNTDPTHASLKEEDDHWEGSVDKESEPQLLSIISSNQTDLSNARQGCFLASSLPQSKDSGFASLERRSSAEGFDSVYQGFIEKEDNDEDDDKNDVYLEPRCVSASLANPNAVNDSNIYDDLEISQVRNYSGKFSSGDTSEGRDNALFVRTADESANNSGCDLEKLPLEDVCQSTTEVNSSVKLDTEDGIVEVEKNIVKIDDDEEHQTRVAATVYLTNLYSSEGEECTSGPKPAQESPTDSPNAFNNVLFCGHVDETLSDVRTDSSAPDVCPDEKGSSCDRGDCSVEELNQKTNEQFFTIRLDGSDRQNADSAVDVPSLEEDSYVEMYTPLDIVHAEDFSTTIRHKQLMSSSDDDEDIEDDVDAQKQRSNAEADEMYDSVNIDSIGQETHAQKDTGMRSGFSDNLDREPHEACSSNVDVSHQGSSGSYERKVEEDILECKDKSIPLLKSGIELSPSIPESATATSADAEAATNLPDKLLEASTNIEQKVSVITEQIPKQSEDSKSPVIRRPKLEKNLSAEIGSDDSSDEDIGIYAESFRRSNWIRVSQEGKLELCVPARSSKSSAESTSTSTGTSISLDQPGSSLTEEEVSASECSSPKVVEDVFVDPLSQAAAKAKLLHKRSDSVTTTASEKEFKGRYISRRKCLIQRADSQQEYHRLSSRVYDQDKLVVVERVSGCDDLGLHLLSSHPAFITSVDPGSAADKAGIVEGQILVSVNDTDVLTCDHAEIVRLIQESKDRVCLGVATSDFQPVRDLQAVAMVGSMYKQGHSTLVKIWKKRYFVLRQDNCLYYYKNEQENDPLGAIPLGGYSISRHTDTSKEFCFKAEKYGARTYYFMTDNRDQLTEWVGALTEAAARSKKRKESFLSVSSHNVSLPALDIRRPECSGFLGKLSPSRRTWRRRYCVLKDACIYYYKDMNSLSALGVAHLHGYKVDAENHSRKKASFSLRPPESRMRLFYFCTDNETDKKRWVESLMHTIQRWVQVDKEADC